MYAAAGDDDDEQLQLTKVVIETLSSSTGYRVPHLGSLSGVGRRTGHRLRPSRLMQDEHGVITCSVKGGNVER